MEEEQGMKEVYTPERTLTHFWAVCPGQLQPLHPLSLLPHSPTAGYGEPTLSSSFEFGLRIKMINVSKTLTYEM